MNYDRMRAMQIFTRVVELGSFTAAAKDLELSQPAVTKSIKSLEDHLGTQLMTRSTRALALTDDGALFYEDARRILEALMEAENRVGKRASVPSGLMRIACPIAFGRLIMVDLVKSFLETHPLIKIELLMEDRMVDLVEQGVDVAIRLGELSDSSLRAQRVGTARRGVFATPTYLARSGTPQSFTDLSRHNCVVLSGLTNRNQWSFETKNGQEFVAVSGNLVCSNSEGARAAVLKGLGIGYHPEWLFSAEIETGEIKPLLESYTPTPLPIHAVYAAGRYISAKSRAFTDHVKIAFADNPALSG